MEVFLLLGVLTFFCTSGMEENPPRLKSLIASFVLKHSALIEQARYVNQDIQKVISQKLINTQLKPLLLPIIFNKPENRKSYSHEGVCGLETSPKSQEIISIDCVGHQIAVCQENAMDNCKVLKTVKGWCCSCFNTELETLYLGDLGGNIGSLDLKSKSEKFFKAHDGTINALSLSCDHNHLVSCSNDHIIKLWEVFHDKKLAEFDGHERSVKNAFFIKAHQKIISAASDKTIRIWDTATAKEEHHYSIEETILVGANFCRLARHPHEQIAVSGFDKGPIGLWDIRKDRHIGLLKGHAGLISALLCSNDGNYAASASWDRDVRLWDLRMMACAAVLSYHKDWVQSIASNNFQRIFSGSRDSTVKNWDLSSILALDSMNDLEETTTKAALIAAEKPITDAQRLAMLKRITAKSQH